MRALSGRRKFARARRAHSFSCDDQLRSVVLRRETERQSCRWPTRRNNCVALSGAEPAGDYTWENQSLIGVNNRLLRHVNADAASAEPQPVYVNFADLSFRIVNTIIISVALALGLLFVTLMPQRGMRTSDIDSIEFALLLLLMLMVTPLSFGYFYSWLMLPFAVVTQQTLARNACLFCGGPCRR